MNHLLQATCWMPTHLVSKSLCSLIVLASFSDPDPEPLKGQDRAGWPVEIAAQGLLSRAHTPMPKPAVRVGIVATGVVRATISVIPDGPETMSIVAGGGSLRSPLFARVKVLPVDRPVEIAKDFVQTMNADARFRDAGVSAALKGADSPEFTIAGPAGVWWKADAGIDLSDD
jgi:hypothetical protein